MVRQRSKARKVFSIARKVFSIIWQQEYRESSRFLFIFLLDFGGITISMLLFLAYLTVSFVL